MDFSTIARSGMTQGEFAQLVGVSRPTANMWVTGKMHPHRYTNAKIALVLEHLQSAIKHGALPLEKGVADRVARVGDAVRDAAARAKTAARSAAAAA